MAPSGADTTTTLSSQRAEALFDLLIHHQTYFDDCLRFNRASGIDNYGPPFDTGAKTVPSSAPVLQTLLYRFVLPLPGARDLSPTFWANVKKLLKDFAAANLSDSYDHAGLGLRRTLATGGAALLEYPAKGVFAGVKKREGKQEEKGYDLSDSDDLRDAWNDFMYELVHGDMVDTLFDQAVKTDALTDHSSIVRAAHEYILIHFASVLHYVFVESPDALYTQKLVSNILKLVPWTMLRSSLRIGNAASMISAITRLFLTKLSLTSITNWMGWSNNPDDGMNLLQQIISTVLQWDISEYDKKLTKIKRTKGAPEDKYFDKIDEYIGSDLPNQEKLRKQSMDQSKSIVTVICEQASYTTLEDEAHSLAIEYTALKSSVRDREQLSRIACKSTPDVLTQTVKEGVAAYDPIIRAVHNAADLSAGCIDLENFLNDLMALFTKQSASAKNGTRTPTPKATQDSQLNHSDVTVEEFANLLRKHQGAMHRFLHQVAQNGEDLRETYRSYVKLATTHFRATSAKGDADDITPTLQKMFSDLSADDREKVLSELDDYTAYLSVLSCVSSDRLRTVVIASPSSSRGGGSGNAPGAGPGGFLARWQALLDVTPTTPVTPKGKVRYGGTRVQNDSDGLQVDSDGKKNLAAEQWRWPEPPKTDKVVEKLGGGFKKLLGELGKKHWEEAKEEDVD